MVILIAAGCDHVVTRLLQGHISFVTILLQPVVCKVVHNHGGYD